MAFIKEVFLAINRENVLSYLNSTITPLGSNASFIGTGEKVFVHDSAVISVYSDQDGTLYVEQSPDGVNWDISSPYSISANIEETNSLIITRQFFRIRYVNGVSAQGFLRIQTLFGTYANISIDTYVGAPGLTNAQLRASPVEVETELIQPLTDTELRATPVEVDTGLNPLTDAELRATPVAVDTGLLQGLTDAELRASPVPTSGTVTANAGTDLNTSALALNSTLTDKSQFVKITDGIDNALVSAAGELNVLATAQPGTDIGDVTINNAAGAGAVNIQDGGNSITVDAVDLDIRDLSHSQDSTKIGDGTYIMKVSANLDAGVSDISNAGGVQAGISVTTTATEARAGGSALANRKNLTIYNNSSADMFWGYTSGVTVSTGTPLVKQSLISLNVGPNTLVYLIVASGSHNARITESA